MTERACSVGWCCKNAKPGTVTPLCPGHQDEWIKHGFKKFETLDKWLAAKNKAPATEADQDSVARRRFLAMADFFKSGTTQKRSAPTENMRLAAEAWAAVGPAIDSDRGRHVIIEQAIEAAVQRCPASLNPVALRAALIFGVENVPASGRYTQKSWTTWTAKVVEAILGGTESLFKTKGAYARALAAIRAPMLGRPARWSGNGVDRSRKTKP
jgi:hypothetical protein